MRVIMPKIMTGEMVQRTKGLTMTPISEAVWKLAAIIGQVRSCAAKETPRSSLRMVGTLPSILMTTGATTMTPIVARKESWKEIDKSQSGW